MTCCKRISCLNKSEFVKENTEMIDVDEFEKVEMRAGTILEVSDNKKSRNPSYVLKIDFGEEFGIKKSSAQITTLYKPEDLIGLQVICCVNLTPMHIGSVKSEVRILGTDSEQGVVLLRPAEPVRNGDKVF
jgi:tRNA-binding protein